MWLKIDFHNWFQVWSFFQEKCYKATSSVDQLAIHFALDGWENTHDKILLLKIIQSVTMRGSSPFTFFMAKTRS